jgi:pyridoxine 5-phosphate synthase
MKLDEIRLGVNIDHVATVRNARGTNYPDPLKAAKIVKEAGGDGITAHLREDRRHIVDQDIVRLKKQNVLPLNLEMAVTSEMQKIALDVLPNAICLVPEKREERTTEGGLDVLSSIPRLRSFIEPIKKKDIRVSLFIEPSEEQIDAAKIIGADIIELHTGHFCDLFEKKDQEYIKVIKTLEKAASYAHKLGLEVHAGHGLTTSSVGHISKIRQIKEFNIGHSIISDSIFLGLRGAIELMKQKIKESRF